MIVYYTKYGHCEAIAQEISKINGMSIFHIEDKKKPNLIIVAINAIRKKKKEGELKEIPNLETSEQVIVVAPIWGGTFPPAINLLLPMIQKHPDIIYIASCASTDGNEKYSPKIQNILPNANVITLPLDLEMDQKISLIKEILSSNISK